MTDLRKRTFLLRLLPSWVSVVFFGNLLPFKNTQRALNNTKLCSFNMIIKYPKNITKEKALTLMAKKYSFERKRKLIDKYIKNKHILIEHSVWLKDNYHWKLVFKNKKVFDRFLKEHGNLVNGNLLFKEEAQLVYGEKFVSGVGQLNVISDNKTSVQFDLKYFSQFEKSSGTRHFSTVRQKG